MKLLDKPVAWCYTVIVGGESNRTLNEKGYLTMMTVKIRNDRNNTVKKFFVKIERATFATCTVYMPKSKSQLAYMKTVCKENKVGCVITL